MKKTLIMLISILSLNLALPITSMTRNDFTILEIQNLAIEKLIKIHNIIYGNNTIPNISTLDHWDNIPIYSPIKLSQLKRISSQFGFRRHPISKKWRMHSGIDFATELNSDVINTCDGVVNFIKKSKLGYGNRVIIKHANGYKTKYAHLNDIFVEIGQNVKSNEVIGTIGSTGYSTGPHLHYEISKNETPIDPMSLICKQNKNKKEYISKLIALNNI